MTDEYDPPTQMQDIHRRVGGWFDAFVGSARYQRLSETERDKASGVVRFFTEYSFRYVGAAPEQWNRSVLTECCREILPRKVSAEPAFFQAIAPVLSAFFEFLADGKLLSNARDLSKAARELNEGIVAESRDERNWGPAKAFVMAAERAGVNTCDQEAMTRFLLEHNLRQLSRLNAVQEAPRPRPASLPGQTTPVRYSQPKPGRNGPCPCGSGKKYKKCCGK